VQEIRVANQEDQLVDRAEPGVAACALTSERLEAPSRSFTAAALDRATLDDAQDEPFVLTLARDEGGLVTEIADAAGVTVDLAFTRLEAVERVFLVIATRGAPEPVVTCELAREVLEKHATGAQAVRLPLAAVIPEEELAKLRWSGSPYRLLASANGRPGDGASPAARWAWTYFHVPSAWDVNTTEGVQVSRVIRLEDDLASLKALKGAATVTPRDAEHLGPLQLPAGVADEVSGFLGKLQDPTNASYDPNKQNVLWQLEDGSYFASTSWASIITLVLDEETGFYEARSLFYHGSSRRLYVVPDGSQREADAVDDRSYRLAKAYVDALKAQKIAQTLYDDVSFIDRMRKTAESVQRPQKLEQRKGEVAVAVINIRGHMPTLGEFRRAQVERTLDPGVNLEERISRGSMMMDLFRVQLLTVGEQIARPVVRKSVHSLDGDTDFGGPRGAPVTGWEQHLLEPGIVVSKAITQGISSCAGGVTYSLDKGERPKVVILWHIDFPPSVPLRAIIDQIWPDPELCPGLRTIAYVFPDSAELNKYRKAMIYPPAIADRSETVFLLRGDHLGVQDFNLGSGSEYFGLDLSSPERVDLVFTHDINKRSEMVASRVDAADDANTSITISAFHRNVFGGYRYGPLAFEGHDRDAMRTYVTKVARTNDDEVKASKVAACEVCRIEGLGPELFGALVEASRPVLDVPCLVLGERVELEFAHGDAEVIEGTRWKTGPLERKKQ
jgi:hypothetical protein